MKQRESLIGYFIKEALFQKNYFSGEPHQIESRFSIGIRLIAKY